MKLLKSLSTRASHFGGSKKTETANEDAITAKTRLSSTDLSSPTKSLVESKSKLKEKHKELQNIDLEEGDDIASIMSPVGKKKKKRKSKRSSSMHNHSTIPDDSIRSERTKSERMPVETPRGKKKKKKKKKGKGGSSRRSEASTIRQSIMLTPSDHERTEHSRIGDSDRHEEGESEGETWLMNFGPNQTISAAFGGPQAMPDLDENDENDLPDENKSMKSNLKLALPPNEDPMNDSKVSLASLADSFVMEPRPPIGELVVGGRGEDDDDDVSEIGEPNVAVDLRTSVRTNDAPDDRDVCFEDRGHPGTRVMTKVIRHLLDENEHAKYTPPMGKLIRRKLRGRRFLVKQRQNGEVTWREAEKVETHRMIAEFFKEERRRKEKGIVDDDSDENSSLQDSARQSEEASLTLEDLNDNDDDDDDDDDTPPPPSSENRPPTPKMANSSSHKKSHPDRKVFLANMPASGTSEGGETTSELLSQIAEQRKNAEDYALPFNSYAMMESGRKAEEKLRALLTKSSHLKAKTQENDEIRLEIHKMDLLVERVMYASIGPLLEMLERMDETMNELADDIDEQNEQFDPTNPKLPSPKRHSGAMRKDRTLGGKVDSETSLVSGSKTNRTIRSGSKSSTKSPKSPRSAANHDSINSIGSGSKTNRTIRSGSKRSRDGRAQSASQDSMNSFGSPGSRRNMDQEGHPRGRSFFNESKLQASGVSVFDDVVSAVPQSQVRRPELSDSEDDELDEDFDEDMDDGTEVEVPLNDEVGYESMDESSGYSGSREKSLDGQSNGTGSSFGIDAFEEQLKMGNEPYTMPLKGGSSGYLSASASFSSDAMTPKSYSQSDSKRNSFASIAEEHGSQGSQSLREHAFNGEARESSQRSTKSGAVVEVSERGGKSDDMSSIGNSHRRLYGSDSDNDEDFLDMDISDVEDVAASKDNGSLDSDDTRTDDASEKAVSVKTQTVGATRVEQFFDRLQHFFEVRRKVEERTEIIDPAGKCRRMKMRVPTKLVPKSNGQYGSMYQQRSTDNEIISSLDELYTVAAQARPALVKVLDSMTDEIMGLDVQSIQVAELKPRGRAFEKAKEDYGDRRPGPAESWLCDVVRASVICKSYKQMNDVNKWLQKNCDVVKAKNRFLEPALNGYRDLLFHVVVSYNGELTHICEIQVHHRDMKALDTQFGMPKHYEFFRSSFAGPWRSQEAIMDDLALMNKHGDVGALMVKLLRSKDPDQLRLFARLCREKMDDFDKALELYRRVLVLQNKEGDKGNQDHASLVDTHKSIGLVYGNKGAIDEALYHLQKALVLQEEGAGCENVQGAELMTEIGRMLSKKGDFEGALQNFEQALEIRENNFGNEHFMVISSLQDIGQSFSDMGDFTASEVSYRKALKLQEKMLNDVHPDIATTSRLIGTTLCKYGDFGTAMELHRLALSIRETSLGKNHPMTAESQTDIGIVLCLKGDLENAEWRHRKALRIRELKGKDDEDCAISLSYLGDVLSRKGDHAEAIKLIKRAKEIRENCLGMDHPVTAATYIDLGNVYYKQGDAGLALAEYRRAKVAREALLGSDHQETAVALSCMGNALNLQGDYQAAHKTHLQALDIYAHFLGEGHPLTATGYQNIADTLLLMGDKEKALIQHRKALAIRANVLSKDHPDTALSCSRIGDLLAEKEDLVGALVAHRQALAILVSLSGEGTVASAKAHIHVGLVLAAQGEFEEAVEEFDQATSVLENVLGEEHEETARAYGLIGSVNSARGDFDNAFDMHSQALTVFEKLFGPKHPKSIAASNKCKMAENQIAETEF
ncbi:unnamed protein product [Cylindrotheca closterium]|uniref:Calmodulin n=1 Tax=Cylindrotheca closterium TaxID=2856 RepID=A0AAD2PVD7_9STRA|nr:unnamed protein product [Cylindrotheca closterium]